MLELRPNSKHGINPLPPESNNAMRCGIEYTYCNNSMDDRLKNVYPNYGGGFTPGSIRPRNNWKYDNDLGKYPAFKNVNHKPVNAETQPALILQLNSISPEDR